MIEDDIEDITPETTKKALSKDIPRCSLCGCICSSGDLYGELWRKLRDDYALMCCECSSRAAGHRVWCPTYVKKGPL